MADAKSLHGRLGRADQSKLNEYFESVRSTEKRIQAAEKVISKLKKPSIPLPAGIPESRHEYLRLMAELFIIAFQNDLTRVATLVVDPERWDSPRMYHGLFDTPQNHHVLTHTKGETARATVAKIDRYHTEFFAHIIDRLKQIPEGDGTLLEHTNIVMGSGISDGDQHQYADLQVLVAGGQIRPGHFHSKGKRPLADLWLAILQHAGGNQMRFADSTGSLGDLWQA